MTTAKILSKLYININYLLDTLNLRLFTLNHIKKPALLHQKAWPQVCCEIAVFTRFSYYFSPLYKTGTLE